MKKGQTIEILGFLALVVVVIISTLGLKLVTVDQKSDVMQLAQESQELESFNSGVKTTMVMTEPTTSKSFVDLMGQIAFFETDTLQFGTTDHITEVNVTKKLTEYLDLIYGKGHWHMDIPLVPKYQMYVIILLDTSLSMKEEINDLAGNIDKISREVKRTTGRRIAYRIYFLDTSNNYKSMFNPAVQNNQDIKTFILDSTCDYITPYPRYKNEAWARGMKCLIEDKNSEWSNIAARVGIIITDEPPGGCEDCACKKHNDELYELCCPSVTACKLIPDGPYCTYKEADIDELIATAININMNIYAMQADPCEWPFNEIPRDHQCSFSPKIIYTCGGEEKLTEFTQKLATGTGGKWFELGNPDEVTERLKEIALSQPIPETPFELGTTIPTSKRIHSYVIPAPTPIPGVYSNVVLKQWN
ncbi:MAG: hypothetical protein ABIG84_07745 [archaeon]